MSDPELVLRPTVNNSNPRIRWALQLRYSGPVETDYSTITRVTDLIAQEIIKAGGARYLFGDGPESEKSLSWEEQLSRLEPASMSLQELQLEVNRLRGLNADVMRHTIGILAAVGNQGQLGLNGSIPWKDPDDLKDFKERTKNCLLLAGFNTFPTVKHLDGTLGRSVICDRPDLTPKTLIDICKSGNKYRVWIIGGEKTYSKWLQRGCIRQTVFTHIDYQGEADTWMPDVWGKP